MIEIKSEYIDYTEFKNIAGVDEAGRGPLAGPVVTAAVILDPEKPIEGLNDSKKLSAKKREELFNIIHHEAINIQVAIISPSQIDRMNILQATMFGMNKAICKLSPVPQLCLIDGNRIPSQLKLEAEAIVKGDAKYCAITAASIIAKVTRDRLMVRLHKDYPVYNFASNKGYPTPDHLAAIRKHGITPHHRKSFSPVTQLTFNFLDDQQSP